MKQQGKGTKTEADMSGWKGWLLGRLRVTRRAPARLAVLERIALAPRQSLALVEAEGRRFLVATSPEGTPAFYPLDRPTGPVAAGQSSGLAAAAGRKAGRVAIRAMRPSSDRDMRISW
ncbi:MAG TPA: flagellar biosynthetic protein FliO [Terracidiphilus sp.]|jgi:hypothetical protein